MNRKITVVFELPEGYEDVHPLLCFEDMNIHPHFPVVEIFDGAPTRVIAQALIEAHTHDAKTRHVGCVVCSLAREVLRRGIE